jgi:tRNA A-37 threonylcarbamoyl transferase component Bud32
MSVAEATSYEMGGVGRTPAEQARLVAEIVEHIDPSFRQSPDFEYAMTDSAKGVFIGETDRGRVAVKPFREMSIRDRADREVDMMLVARSRGFQTFPTPRVHEEDLATYLITDYLPGVRSMNAVSWERPIDSNIYQQEHIPLLGHMGDFVGEMHGKNIAHHDLWLKNLARKVDGGFILMDLEKAEVCDDMSDAEKLVAFNEDLEKLVCSLVRKQFLNTPEWSVIEQELLAHLIEPYLAALTRNRGSVEIGLEASVTALSVAEATHAVIASRIRSS